MEREPTSTSKRKLRAAAVFAQKGGSGKSTIAVHLAVVAGHRHRVLLVDADPQATVATWSKERSAPTPVVARADPGCIEDVLDAADSEGFNLAIVDCPPHAAPGIHALLMATDHVVIPVQPTMPDLAAIGRTMAIVRAAGKPFTFVVNRAPARSADVGEAIEALSAGGVVVPVPIGDRRAFARALTTGAAVSEFAQPNAKAVQEIQACWAWFEQRIFFLEPDAWQQAA
jgi:chromosome partitioning protein